MTTAKNPAEADKYKIAGYVRRSHDDGDDRMESLSITNQKLKLSIYSKSLGDGTEITFYVDDGWPGTNFERPDFKRLLHDIERGMIDCVICKDLSRLGRDSPETTKLISDYFPEHRVRFIAIDDNVDRQYFDYDTTQDMQIEMKNMFNGFYPKDISSKVRSTFRAKQKSGQFIGAFASYGYRKDPDDHNTLLIDETAAEVVRSIFAMYLSGMGKITIAKALNEKGIPCPSEYKRQCGMNYRNCNKLNSTTYWTYSSINAILKNAIYTGDMVQNKTVRRMCRQKAAPLPKEQWIVVPNTHEAIIDPDTFAKVQTLMKEHTKQPKLKQNIHIFAGLLKCGDCGRAMVKITRRGIPVFYCGSFNRYGKHICSSHAISPDVLSNLVLEDFNKMLKSSGNLETIIKEETEKRNKKQSTSQTETEILEKNIEKWKIKKANAYNDYNDNLITKDEYVTFKKQCEDRISTLESKMALMPREKVKIQPQWITRLSETGQLEMLDRATVIEIVKQIYIYKDNTIKIIYNFNQIPNEHLK